MSNTGKVYLVGAGPGDPGLLTVRALELIRRAQVIIYDRLVGKRIIDQANTEAEKIYVGKESNRHTLPQEEINRLLAAKAREGKMVVRLKGGDPFLFGRGGEEAQYLRRNGVEVEIVPGVTSAIAAPAYAGIPVTHRDYNSTLTIITGHERQDKLVDSVPWKEVAAGKGTLVFLMGMENLPFIVEKLLAGGRSPDTPVALVRWGTLPQQEVLEATLENVVERVRTRGFLPPAVIVVGEVVRLRQELAWFDRRPLFGKTILVTRARAQASRLVTLLEELGASVVELPTIAVKPLPVANLPAIIPGMEKYSWIVFTSVNGVKIFIAHLLEHGFDIRDLKGPRICAIGPATAAEAESWGMRVSAVPEEFRAEAVAEVLLSHAGAGDRILLPRARGAREILPQLLRAQGVMVDELEIYEAVTETMLDEENRRLLEEGLVDVITFTSSSTVKNLVAIIGEEMVGTLRGRVKVACIGPITAQTAREAGFEVDVVAAEYTIDGLVQAIIEACAGA
ncbi:MAG: uroporphyrinogen-III C-methyltransferase [Syntrophomonadaceae bacterium]|nr:uroporphyrinogen-III C-methyltransferase [Syntrophomonadaceae bacterium]